jgi:hypothetical protein
MLTTDMVASVFAIANLASLRHREGSSLQGAQRRSNPDFAATLGELRKIISLDCFASAYALRAPADSYPP